MKRIKKKLKRFWHWYVLGYYHCEHCPYCWSDYSSYLGDGDCGCYIFGDIRDTCRLLPPLRFLLGWARKKKALYWQDHQYDDMGPWFEKRQEQEEIMRTTLLFALEDREVYWRDFEGKLQPACKTELVEERAFAAMEQYEDAAHPHAYVSLKQKWKTLLSETWDAFLDLFRPYLT